MNNKPTPTAEQMAVIQALAAGTVKPGRSPLLKTPADYDLEYEDIFFHRLMVYRSKRGLFLRTQTN